MATLPCLIFSFALASSVSAYTYHVGDCPVVEPVKHFNITMFLGQWDVIEETATVTTTECLTYSYTTNDIAKDQYIWERFGISWIGRKTSKKRGISIDNPKIPAAMTVHYPIGTASQIVFTTDYTNYAGIITCQQLAFAHRLSAAILSRKKTLEHKYLDNIHSNLKSFGVDVGDLEPIRHFNCGKLGRLI